MKVKVEREVDLNWLIKQLDQKSRVHPQGMGGYEVRVDKQLLRDAHDVIVHLRSQQPIINFSGSSFTLSYKD